MSARTVKHVTTFIKVESAAAGMVLGDHVYARNNTLILSKGMRITGSHLERLRNFRKSGLIGEKICVSYEQRL